MNTKKMIQKKGDQMKILEIKQGTPEWFEARKGIATASNFDKIVTTIL